MTIRSLVLPRTEEDHATQQWVLAGIAATLGAATLIGAVLFEHEPRFFRRLTLLLCVACLVWTLSALRYGLLRKPGAAQDPPPAPWPLLVRFAAAPFVLWVSTLAALERGVDIDALLRRAEQPAPPGPAWCPPKRDWLLRPVDASGVAVVVIDASLLRRADSACSIL